MRPGGCKALPCPLLWARPLPWLPPLCLHWTVIPHQSPSPGAAVHGFSIKNPLLTVLRQLPLPSTAPSQLSTLAQNWDHLGSFQHD